MLFFSQFKKQQNEIKMTVGKFVKIYILLHIVVVLCKGQSSFTKIPDSERQFRVVYEWNTVDFAFGSDQLRSNAIYSGEFIPQNNIISDVKAYANRLYVTIPRMLPGVPATLGYVVSPDNNGKTDPGIEAFPSWAMNQKGNCSALQFVQGIAIDANGILWAVDSGRVETLVPGTINYYIYLINHFGHVLHLFILERDFNMFITKYLFLFLLFSSLLLSSLLRAYYRWATTIFMCSKIGVNGFTSQWHCHTTVRVSRGCCRKRNKLFE